MKIKTIIFYFIFLSFKTYSQSCNAMFSFGAYFEKVHFFNSSQGSYLKYFWNFGDGTSSYYKDPIHTYPGNGNYLVTLYVHDTVNNISDFHDVWLTATKVNSDPCVPSISDSIYLTGAGYYLKILDYSQNCSTYPKSYFSAFGNNLSIFHYLGNHAGNYITYAAFSGTNSTIYGLKTSPHLYNRSKNYNSCSANFEFSIVEQDTDYQVIRFKAMNKNAKSYKWVVPGFGEAIVRQTDTMAIRYICEYNQYGYSTYLPVYLVVTEQNGCIDTLFQDIACSSRSVTTVGIEDYSNESKNIHLYPNPVKDKLSLIFDEKNIAIKSISIFNTLGQQLYFTVSFVKEIDLSFLSKGVYFFSVRAANSERVYKVLKE